MSTQTASDPAAVDRNWILSEFSKGIDAEGQMAHEAQAQADAPPEPALGVLYAQIAEADLRHHDAVETIAVRYGLTPGQGHHGFASNIGETLGRLKDKVTGAASNSLERLGHHLAAKSSALHWYAAWVNAFEAIGDTESARELASILTEEKAHHDALQAVLNRMVEQGARGAAK